MSARDGNEKDWRATWCAVAFDVADRTGCAGGGAEGAAASRRSGKSCETKQSKTNLRVSATMCTPKHSLSELAFGDDLDDAPGADMEVAALGGSEARSSRSVSDALRTRARGTPPCMLSGCAVALYVCRPTLTLPLCRRWWDAVIRDRAPVFDHARLHWRDFAWARLCLYA